MAGSARQNIASYGRKDRVSPNSALSEGDKRSEPEGNAPAEIAAEIQKWSAKGIQDVAKIGGKTLKSNAVRFIAVLAGPRNFFKSIDHQADHALIDASVFAIFISVVNLIISLPAYRLANIKTEYFDVCFDRYDDYLRFLVLVQLQVYHFCARLIKGACIGIKAAL